MLNLNIAASDAVLLVQVADLLLWDGKDRAADLIYAALEADMPASASHTGGDWQDVFAS